MYHSNFVNSLVLFKRLTRGHEVNIGTPTLVILTGALQNLATLVRIHSL